MTKCLAGAIVCAPTVLHVPLAKKCVARGLSAVQGDANRDLADYPDDAFDYAILSQTLQTADLVHEPARDPLAVQPHGQAAE